MSSGTLTMFSIPNRLLAAVREIRAEWSLRWTDYLHAVGRGVTDSEDGCSSDDTRPCQAFRSIHSQNASTSCAPALSAMSRSVPVRMIVVQWARHLPAVVLVRPVFVVQLRVVTGRPSPLVPSFEAAPISESRTRKI